MKKSTLWVLVTIAVSLLVTPVCIRMSHDRKSAEIRTDFEEKTAEFENTVNNDLHDMVCCASTDITDTSITGRVEIKPVHYHDSYWCEFNTYVDVRAYVKRDMSRMDPFEIRDYLQPISNHIIIKMGDYRDNVFPLRYYRTDEGLEKLGKYVFGVNYIPHPMTTDVYVIDTNGDEYKYAGMFAYYLNGEVVEKPFLGNHSSSGQNSSNSGQNSSGSGHSSSSSSHYSSDDFAWDVDDYDNPDEYADDAWGEDFDDWDDAYDYWENNY